MNIYCVIDRLAQQVTGQIFTARAHAAAVRLFIDLLSDTRTTPGQHPMDFDLVCLGHLVDHDTAFKTAEDQPNSEIRITTDGTHVILTGEAWLATQKPTLSKEA